MSDETWLEWRRGGTGASDIAASVTGHFGGDVKVVARKIGAAPDDISPGLADRGKRWEQPLADALLATHGLHAIGEQVWAEHPERPRDRATVEGFLYHKPEASIDDVDTLFEIKTRGLSAPWRWDYWTTQTHWQMHVTGMARCLLIVATINDAETDPARQLRGIEYRWIERDDHLIERLVVEADRLWSYVEARQLPEPSDGSALEFVREAYATTAADATADLDPVVDDIATFAELKVRAKAADDALKLAEAKIRTAMAEATEAVTSDGRWRVRVGEPIAKFTRDSEADALQLYPDYGKTVLDRERFKNHRRDDYELLKRPTSDRRLTIKEMSE